MNKPTIALAGAGIGAALMYMMDPASGRRRRGRARDLTVHTTRVIQTATGASSRDLVNRLSSLVARSRPWIAAEPPSPDDVVVARVRSQLGRLVANPGEVEVHAKEGVVTLSGAVAETEAADLLAAVGRIHGVSAVGDRLERRAVAAEMPEKRLRWTPALRLLAGAAGLALTALASREETPKA